MSNWFIEGAFTGRQERRRPAPTAAELSIVLLDREVDAALSKEVK